MIIQPTINVICEQLNQVLKVPFQDKQPAKQLLDAVQQQLNLPQETIIILKVNSKSINQAELQKILEQQAIQKVEIQLTQTVEIPFCSAFTNNQKLKIDLWSKVKDIEENLLKQFYSQIQYDVSLFHNNKLLPREDNCYTQGIRNNSTINFEILVELKLEYGSENKVIKVNVFILIRDLKQKIQQEFGKNQVVKVMYEGLELEEDESEPTLFCYSVEKSCTLKIYFDQPEQEEKLKICLCNKVDQTQIREIYVLPSDNIAILDQELQNLIISTVYTFQEMQLEKNKSFANQGIGNGAKILYLQQLIQAEPDQISITFVKQSDDDDAPIQVLKVLIDNPVELEFQKLIQPGTNLDSYCFSYNNKEIINYSLTFRQLNIYNEDLISYGVKQVEIFFNAKSYKLALNLATTVQEAIIIFEQKLKLTGCKLYQEGKQLPLEDKIMKYDPKKSFNLTGRLSHIAKQDNQNITLRMIPANIDIKLPLSKHDTVEQLLNQLKKDQGFPINQPMQVTIEKKKIEPNFCLFGIKTIQVEVFDKMTINFQNIETQENITFLAPFEDKIKISVDSYQLSNSIFSHNNKELNINATFRESGIFNNDIIYYKLMVEVITINLKYKGKQQKQFQEKEIQNIVLDQLIKNLQVKLIQEFDLELDTVLKYGSKQLEPETTLRQNNILNNSQILAIPILINLKISHDKSNQKWSKYVRPCSKVADLIETIKKDLGFPFQLKYLNTILSPDKTFNQLGLQNESKLEIIQ